MDLDLDLRTVDLDLDLHLVLTVAGLVTSLEISFTALFYLIKGVIFNPRNVCS